MENLYQQITKLVKQNDVRVSVHGYERSSEHDILIRDIIASIERALVVEQYPEYRKGPCILLLQKDHNGKPIHVLWGIPKGKDSPAVF
ncbi:MAG: DUF4258 domain-containing protein [candidate division KSB1 bacterium]|nr:DUF4258 domain-containing protein [candidate division KSB1 bacterium]